MTENETSITVNLDGLTIGDMELFDEWQSGRMEMKKMIGFLERIVTTEKPLREMPITSIGKIIEAIRDALQGMQNPKN